MAKSKVETVAQVIGKNIAESNEEEVSIIELYAYKLKTLKLNVTARKAVAKQLTVEEKNALNWQTVGDIFSFLDASSLAKENPKEAARLLKLIVGIVGALVPTFAPISAVIVMLSTKDAATLVEWLGKPTPEHVVHEIAKRKSKKLKKYL